MKRVTVTYRVNGGEEKTETIYVDTTYGDSMDHMIKVELNETVENNVGIKNIEIVRRH